MNKKRMTEKMSILHVIAGIPMSAGTSTFCGEVCNQLAALEYDVTIALRNPKQANLYPLDSRVKLISIEEVVVKGSTITTNNCNLIHIHGLWSPILHRVSNWAHAHNIPVVWSTHGMTAPWAMKHKWWKKCLPWYLYQRRDLKRARLIHCTSDFEIEWNRLLGFEDTFLTPLGTFLPEAKARGEGEQRNVKTLLFVGRIYPVKALDRLIEAFGKAKRLGEGELWTLRIVGPDQAGHTAALMALCEKLEIPYSAPHEYIDNAATHQYVSPSPLVQFVEPKYGQELEWEYANCTALALVSHTENFGATVIDALAHGKPVITSTKTPWKIVADNECGWWVDNGVESLTGALSLLMATPKEVQRAMGIRGRKLVEEQFSWAAVAQSILTAYKNCLDKTREYNQ